MGSQESFQHALVWIKELQRHANANILIMLVGNKVDMNVHRVVSADAAQAFAEEQGLLYGETSAKDDTNITETFDTIGTSFHTYSAGKDHRIIVSNDGLISAVWNGLTILLLQLIYYRGGHQKNTVRLRWPLLCCQR